MSRFNKLLDRLLLVTTILFSSHLFESCSKDVDQIGSEAQVSLSFSIGGIYDDNSNNLLKANTINNNFSLEEKKGIGVNSISKKNGNIVLDMITEESRIIDSFPSSISDINKKLANTVNMKNNIRYRILVYTMDNDLIASTEGTVGERLNISVTRNQSYKWYAYSFNTTDQIPDPTLSPNSPSNPSIITPYTTTLLYASNSTGTPLITANGTPISIIFKHQLTQLNVELDARGMFADIVTLDANFQGDYVKTSSFDLLTGQKFGQLSSANISQISFISKDEDSDRIKLAKYYTADPSLTQYSIKVTSLTVRYPNNNTEDMMSKISGNETVTFGTFDNSNVGYSLKGLLKLWLVLPTKSMLHYGTGAANRGYDAAEGSTSGYFVRSPYNFSPTSDYFKIDGFTHTQVISGSNRMRDALADPATFPDVIICGIFDGMNANDYDALEKYLKRGGVVFLMTESTDTDLRNFFRNLFNNQNITIARHDGGGAVYKFNDVDARVSNGLFGDVGGAYWGQDRSLTQYISNIDPNDIVVYSGISVNGATTYDGVTMFRHKDLNLFFTGDTGFLASTQQAAGGAVNSNTGYPFATIGGSGTDKYFPTTKAFGTASNANALEPRMSAGSWQVSNAIIFANALSWMLERAHFDPVDRSPF